MKYVSAQIVNYKSFPETEPFNLSPGFNVIVGKNNSGKTALTETLAMQFANHPYRSKYSLPERRTKLEPLSALIATIEVSLDEIRSIVFNSDPTFSMPFVPSISVRVQEHQLAQVFKQEKAKIKFRYSDGTIKSSFLLPHWEIEAGNAIRYRLNEQTGPLQQIGSGVGWLDSEDLAHRVAKEFIARVYGFRAERFHVGQSPSSESFQLNTDAGNLPAVLMNLKAGNDFSFNKLRSHLRSIFPEITNINIVPIDDAKGVKIFLSDLEIDINRTDLDIPLQDSGTGIGQVLAVLYVVITAKYPQVFVIDEPQSFLHPEAVRKLFGLLNKEFSQNQYIITTHSASALFSANPDLILHVSKDGPVSKIREIDLADRTALASALMDVGARPTDVFGASGILWVEGKTEEMCFPGIVLHKCKNHLLGNVILGIANKGDFEGRKKKNVELVADIYARLSGSVVLLPPAIGFVFDQEGLKPEEISDIQRLLEGKIHFIGRRMYENYLIHPGALLALVSQLPDFSQNNISKEEIAEWIQDNMWEVVFFDKKIPEEERSEEFWKSNVNGALFLDRLVSSLSEGRYTYIPNKVRYGKSLTDWLLENDDEGFEDIAILLDKLVGPAKA